MPYADRLRFRYYPALAYALLLVVGLLFGHTYPSIGGGLGIMALSLIFFLSTLHRSWRYTSWSTWGVLLALFFAILSLAQIRATTDIATLNSPIVRETVLRGIVVSTPQKTEKGKIRVILKSQERQFLCYLPQLSDLSHTLRLGDTILLDTSSRPVLPLSAIQQNQPFYYRYLIAQHASGVLYASSYLHYPLQESRSLYVWADQGRQFLEQQLEKLPVNREIRAMLATMVLGKRDGNEAYNERFRAAGVAHLLAVSGFHLGVVVALFSILWRPPRRQGLRLVRSLFLLLLAWGFTLITGLASPTVRAATMYSCYQMGYILQKPQYTLNSLGLSAMILLLWHPGYLYDIGFQLSFTAVISIVLYQKLFTPWLRGIYNPIIRYGVYSWVISFSAQLLVIPLVAYHFGSYSTISLWSNVPLMFLATLVIPLCILFLIAASLGWFVAPLAQLIAYLSDVMYRITTFFAGLQYNKVSLSISFWQALGLVLMLLALWGWIYIVIEHRQEDHLRRGLRI